MTRASEVKRGAAVVPQARPTYHHGDLREALLAAGDALIAEKGVSGFSLREAARRVGVDPAACYRHFRDKDAIFQELARRGFTRLAARMKADLAAIARTSPERSLVALGHAYVGFALEHPSSYRAMFGPTGVDARDDLLRGAYPEGEGPYDLLKETVRAWAERIERDIDVDDASVALWASVHGIASLLIEGALRPEDEKAQRRILDTTLAAMLAGFEHGARSRKSKRVR